MADLWMDVDANLSEVPVNLMPLVDDADFKSIETCTYNQAGLALFWNFTTTAGAFSHTAVTPTDTGGDYDWVSQGNGMFTIEIPATGGASINNDTEGFGWFTGVATGILPWRGPVIGFRAAGLNDKLIDSAYDAYRGLAGTALPAAAADGAGGLPISDAGGLDLDNDVANKLVAINLDHLVKVAKDTNWATTVTKESIIDLMTSKDTNQTYDRTTESLEVIKDVGVTVGDVTLAASQPSYDPIAAMTTLIGTPADTDVSTDIANVAAQLPAALTAGGFIMADAVAINGVATTSVTAVNANQGTTQPVGFTGTGASAKVNAQIQASDDIDFTATQKTSLGTAVGTAQTGDSYAQVTSVTYGLSALNTKIGTPADTDVSTDIANVAGQITGLNNISTAQVNAEVVDALNVDTYAEPGQEAPAATNTLVKKIGYLFKAWRNLTTQTATDYKLYNDAGAVVDQKATTSDDGTTFTRTKIGTGP